MPTDDGNNEPSNTTTNEPEGPGQHRMRPIWIVLVAVYLVVVSLGVLYGLIKLWPYPTPGGTEQTNSNSNQNPSGPNGSQPTGNNSNNSNQQGTSSQQTGSTAQPSNQQGGTAPRNPAGNAQTNPQATNSTQPASAGSQPQTGSTQAANTQAAASQSNEAASSLSQPKADDENKEVAMGPCATPTPTPKPGATPTLPDPDCIKFMFVEKPVPVYLETRLLLLVMLAGALGSLMHALRSLYWYTGNRMMVWSWVAFYLLLPFTGAILAVIFYFVVRGGFFSPQSSFAQTSPFGFAALAALVGLFSPQATLKLKEIAETIFSKPGAGADHKPQESASQAPPTKPAPTVATLDRTSGAANDSVVITGTGFSPGATVKFGEVAAVVSALTETSITAVVPDNQSATAPVDVVVTNADGQTATSPQKFSYVAGGGNTDELEGDDEIKSNTTDEELPITEGGVG